MLTDVRPRAAIGTALRRTAALATAAGCDGCARPAAAPPGRRSPSTAASTRRRPPPSWPRSRRRRDIQVNVRSNDEAVLASQIDAEGSQLAGRRRLHGELTAAPVPRRSAIASPRCPAATLAATPARYNSPTGDWVGVSARVSVLVYNTHLLTPSQLPSSVLDLAAAALSRASSRSPRTRPTSSRSSPRSPAPTARRPRCAGCEGLKANASGHIYPDNETVDRRGQPRQAAHRGHQPVLLVPPARPGRRGDVHSAIAFFAPHDPGYVVDVSGAAVLASSPHQRRRREVRRLPRQQGGPDDHRPQRQLRVPDRLGRRRTGRATPLVGARSPTRSTSPRSATGRPPLRSCARRSCCEHDGRGDCPRPSARTGRARGLAAVRRRRRARTPPPAAAAPAGSSPSCSLLPLVFLLARGRAGRLVDAPPAAVPPPDGHAAVEHRVAHGRRDASCAR